MELVLIVDDVPAVRLVIKKILTRAGYAAVEAADGTEALAKLSTCKPAVVVTDLWMPWMDGLQLLEVLQRDWPDISVIAMTGGAPQQSQEASLARARSAGVEQVLMKPIDKDELIAAVRQAVHRVALLPVTLSAVTRPAGVQPSPPRK